MPSVLSTLRQQSATSKKLQQRLVANVHSLPGSAGGATPAAGAGLRSTNAATVVPAFYHGHHSRRGVTTTSGSGGSGSSSPRSSAVVTSLTGSTRSASSAAAVNTSNVVLEAGVVEADSAPALRTGTGSAVAFSLSSMLSTTSADLAFTDQFPDRHIGPSDAEIAAMCNAIGVADMDELMEQAIPPHIRRSLTEAQLAAPATRSETEVLQILKDVMSQNQSRKNFLGQGYHGTLTPACILRNLLENPAWYTAYTPYQAEISQGRMESLVNYQTLVTELTKMEVSNASLLDEGSAAAEALSMLLRVSNLKKKDTFFISDSVHPQTIQTVQSRAKYMNVNILVAKTEDFDFSRENLIGALVQYPDTFGHLQDFSSVAETLHAHKGHLVVAADPLALMVCKPPGEMGADVVVGNMQRFGVPMFSGGPSAAFFATHMKNLRKVPGRIIGVSRDAEGTEAFRLTLQTREQHIRYEKATSNVCTSQVLLANTSAMYAVYHQKSGLQKIAKRVHGLTTLFADELPRLIGDAAVVDTSRPFFDSVVVNTLPRSANEAAALMAEAHATNVRILGPSRISVSFDESHSQADVLDLASQLAAIIQAPSHTTTTLNAVKSLGSASSPLHSSADLLRALEARHATFSSPRSSGTEASMHESSNYMMEMEGEAPVRALQSCIPESLQRDAAKFLNQKIFNTINSETEMMRYLHRLQSKDLSLCHSMISLGSCTMKLNSASSLMPISWDTVANVHPFSPADSVPGYARMLHELEQFLCRITAFEACSLQPASGAMGEYAGLMAIRRYHESRGDAQRNVCIIPRSAHGTNPASAAMIGMEVKWIDDSKGTLDVEELTALAAEYKDRLAALMITYPSTQGVFEEEIVRICSAIHNNGGMVYMDGANMNAHLGLTAPGVIGADVCHLNLHKTFSIPHGGGGPGMGPICCNSKLAPFLPGHFKLGDAEGAVQNAPYGQAGIAAIPWMFIAMLGAQGLRRSAEVSILNANYLKEKLAAHYQIAKSNKNDRCSHEFILDVGDLKKKTGITEEDIAKRLQDYGYHAPTMSWPKPHSLMIEPTESEDQRELDRFLEALIQIREEIRKVESGDWSIEDNPLKNAPHPQSRVCASEWHHGYTRETAAFPLPYIAERGKIWPACGRVSNSYGDKNIKVTHTQ